MGAYIEFFLCILHSLQFNDNNIVEMMREKLRTVNGYHFDEMERLTGRLKVLSTNSDHQQSVIEQLRDECFSKNAQIIHLKNALDKKEGEKEKFNDEEANHQALDVEPNDIDCGTAIVELRDRLEKLKILRETGEKNDAEQAELMKEIVAKEQMMRLSRLKVKLSRIAANPDFDDIENIYALIENVASYMKERSSMNHDEQTAASSLVRRFTGVLGHVIGNSRVKNKFKM